MLVWSIAINGGLVMLWTISRTLGLPFGPETWTPEALGLPDIVATAYEAVAAMGILWLLRWGGSAHTASDRTDDVIAMHLRIARWGGIGVLLGVAAYAVLDGTALLS